MDHIRDDIKQLLKEKLCIEVPDHSVFTNPDNFKGFLKILDGDLDFVVDNIITIIQEGK